MSIQKRSYPPSTRFPKGRTVWRVRWLDRALHRSREFAFHHEAREFEGGILSDAAPASKGLRDTPTMSEFWLAWIANREAAVLPSTAKVYRSAWRHIEPVLGEQRLHELEDRPKLLSDFLVSLAVHDRATGRPPVGRVMRGKVHTVLNGMLGSAVGWKYLRSNPMETIRERPPPQRRQREIVAVSARRIEAMRSALLRGADVAPQRCQRDVALLMLLAYCGLRPAEALALTWADVDLDARAVWVGARNSDGVRRAPKSAASVRSVPIPTPALSDLRAHRMASRTDGDDTSAVFPNDRRALWTGDQWRAWTRKTFRHLARSVELTSARPYDLRHSFVLRLILAGRTIPEVADIAGHDPAVTAAIYLGAYRQRSKLGIQRDDDIDEHIIAARRAVSSGEVAPPDW